MGNLDDPAFLPVGTEVSAKYKGAFCEAKIKKISKLIKCKVQYSNGTVSLLTDEAIKGPLKVGATVEIKGDKKDLGEATLQKIQDCSQYTVVFDDGDITCLKRTALCLKSGRHFAASSSLDQLPLTHPEHNISLNGTNTVRGRRSRKENTILGIDIKEEVIEMVEFEIGSVLCVETNDKKKVRDNWFPGLIVAPTAQSSIKTNTAKEYLVRSFKDGKYYSVQKKESLKLYTSEIGAKVENPTLKTAVEKTQLYITRDELPPHWDRDLLFGTDKCITTDSEGAYDSENSDDESIEEKDHFVAQLIKFMDDRGTPINVIPQINDKDLDLYKLFKVVNNLGGLNKVSKYDHWHIVAFKMGEENMTKDDAVCFKRAYQVYLHGFEDFHRKLGCTMLSHPRGVRSRSRFSRSIIRDIDKTLPSTSTAEKNKQSSAKQESNEKKDKAETTKENDTFKDPMTIKKPTKSSKSDDKLNKSNHESAKKGEKKKDDINTNTSRNKSVKWDPEILDSKDSKTKKELKETVKKEPDAKDIDNENITKKEPKKKNARNIFGKNTKKTPKKEKIVKVKSAETGLPALRKVRSIKEQIKTFVKVITPFSKSKRGVSNTQQESLNKTKLDEDVPKLTRSKSKEEVPNKSRRVSILSDGIVSSATLQPGSSGSVVDSQSKVKKLEDGSEKKKAVRKKKDDKDDKFTTNDLNTTTISNEVETSSKDPPPEISNGDHIVVYYGEDDPITYDAKILRISRVEGALKYLVHYKGWNSRYDEWVDSSRTALKTKNSAREPEHDETDSLKNEPKSVDSKKTTPVNRIRRSATPSLSNSNRKKSPFCSIRPTRTCTLNDRLLSSIDNSDSESEDIGTLELTKPNKRNQQSINSIKSEPEDIVIKTEPIETDNQKKMYPKTYPSKEVLMQRNIPRKPKSCVFKVNSNKSNEIETCEQVTLKPPFEYNFEMPPPSNVKKSNLSNKNEEVLNKSKIDKDTLNEPKIAHYLSPKEKSEKNIQQQQSISETKKKTDEVELNVESQKLQAKPKSTGVIYYPSSLKEEERRESEQISLRNEKSDESKISGTDFDLNKIRSEMKGLMPTSTNSNLDLIHNTESINDQQVVEIPKSIEPITEDVYEFTESEPCDFQNIPSVIEEKQRRVIKHIDPSKPHNNDQPVELSKIVESITSVKAVEQNESMKLVESDVRNNTYLFDNGIKIDAKDNLKIKNEVENSVSHNESDIESIASENLMINDVISDTNRISQNKGCLIDETDIKDEVLDLCMKPPESPPSNIFSMPESNETNDIGDDDDDDDDESKLVIAENDKIDNDFQMDANQVSGEENNCSNEQSENVLISSSPPPPLPPSIHQLPCTDSEFHSSYEEQKNNSIPKDIDDESTTSCNESEQNTLIQNFQMYSHFENQSIKTKDYQSYIDNNDDSTKSGFEFDSNSKSPTIDNTEGVVSAAKLSIYESTNNIKQEVDDYEDERVDDKPEKVNSSILPELQCREEIVDEETLNNALVIEYNRKNIDYDIHKPSTSKGFFDSVNRPSTSKDRFYETDTESDSKKGFFESKQANLVKSVIFDPNLPSTSRSGLFDENTLGTNSKDNFYNSGPSTSKNTRFYENSAPCSSKSFYNPDPDVNNVLFCEETIPGSPTGITEDHYDHEERKRVASQEVYEGREGREAREAASTMFAMKESYHRPMITLMGASEKELEEYTNMLQNDGGLLDQRHLQFLAEISSRNLNININEPPVTEPSTSEGTKKSSEKSHTKRKNSNHEQSTSKRNKTSSAASTSGDTNDKPVDFKVPLRDGKPLIVFTPEMTSSQRQALLLARMNDLRNEYSVVKARISIIDRRRKKIRKRKRELAKAATMAQNKQNLVACAAK